MVVGVIDLNHRFANHHADPILSTNPRAILAVYFRGRFIAKRLLRPTITRPQPGSSPACLWYRPHLHIYHVSSQLDIRTGEAVLGQE